MDWRKHCFSKTGQQRLCLTTPNRELVPSDCIAAATTGSTPHHAQASKGYLEHNTTTPTHTQTMTHTRTTVMIPSAREGTHANKGRVRYSAIQSYQVSQHARQQLPCPSCHRHPSNQELHIRRQEADTIWHQHKQVDEWNTSRTDSHPARFQGTSCMLPGSRWHRLTLAASVSHTPSCHCCCSSTCRQLAAPGNPRCCWYFFPNWP